jgi:hypothetical protein
MRVTARDLAGPLAARTARQRRAAAMPRGANPFSAPELFAGSPRLPPRRENRGIPTATSLAPIATNVRVLARQPVIRSSNGRNYISGFEEFATVNGSVAFTATKYEFNPGLAAYTWLAGQSAGWEKHHFRRLQFVYVPAEAVTTTAGSVYLAADYDPVDPAPPTLASLSTYESQVNGRVYEKLTLTCAPARMYDGVQNKRIRDGPVTGDLELYDPCSFTFATIACANANAIGQLWVYYEVDLISRQTDTGTPVPPSLVVRNGSANQGLATATPENIDFDEVITAGFSTTNVAGLLTLPPGAYTIQGQVCFIDSAAETLTTVLELYINGAAVSPPQNVNNTHASVAASGTNVPFLFFTAQTASFTLGIRATATGAAGTLTTLADATRLFIKAT